MAVLSGKYGQVVIGTVQSTVRNWRVSETIESKQFVASNTNLGTNRRKGVLDWSGNYQQYTPTPSTMPGQSGGFTGCCGPTTGVAGTTGTTVSGGYICESISVALNWGSAELIQSTVNMQGNGALSVTLAVQPDDTSQAQAFPSGGGHVEIAKVTGSVIGTYNQLCTTAATFNLMCNIIPYSDSCTWNATRQVMMRGKVGGPVDWNLTITADDMSLFTGAPPFAVGDFVVVKLFVDPSNFWFLQYGIVDSLSDFVVDIETGAIITYNINILMSGDNAAEASDGVIGIPGGTTYWPFAA